MSERLRFFAPCPSGVEPLLAEELRRLKLRGVRPQRSGVLFAGTVADGQRALFWTRLASRVLLTLGEVDASTPDSLYEGIRDLAWEDHLRAGGTLAVDAAGVNDALRNTQFTAVRVKDGIVDRFRDRFGRRPSVDVKSPDVRVNVAVRGARATVSIDLAGEPLHRRGYREPGVQVEAPMKETMAAAVLEAVGWREIAGQGGSFLDPMCGSGTLAIEAALAAADIAPGLLRPERPVQRWLGFDAAAWQRLIEQAERRRSAGLESLPPIAASDADRRAVEIARRCVARAGLEGRVDVAQRQLADMPSPDGVTPGLVATNPPWGERLSDRRELPPLYRTLAEQTARYVGWRLAVVSPDPALGQGLGMRPRKALTLGSGKGAVTFSVFELTGVAPAPAPVKSTPNAVPTKAEGATPTASAAGAPAPPALASEFANRLGKMAKHYGKWARRSGVSCFRVYDADLPDFAVAVDLYQGAGPDDGKRWVHLAEYAPPAHIDESKAAARLEAAASAAAIVLDVDPSAVFVKRRERQRGSAQYERQSRSGVKGVVGEGGLLFEVNFSDYLDTGLFLDHRDTRSWLRELADDRRFLNLFAYTGSASVYAAAGGAQRSVTVDLSATYLAWAERNLALNGLSGDQHLRVREDTLVWLETAREAGERFDLVFCDPPTFSNSKRMDGTWDVQRDHAALLGMVEGVLAEDGLVIFSCNRRGFVLDEEALGAEGLVAEDVTARTIPKDFERTPGVHRCWKMRRR